MRKAFDGDPLDCIADPKQRRDLYYETELRDDRDQARKKIALAAYFATMSGKPMAVCWDNFDSLFVRYFSEGTSVDDAYEETGRLLRGEREPVWSYLKRAIRENLWLMFLIVVITIISLGTVSIFLLYRLCKVIKKTKPYLDRKAWGSMADRQKLFLCMAGAAVVLLAVAIVTTATGARIPYGFFVFMRIVTCAALAGLLLEKLPIWAKFALLLLAILYNPVVPIHLGKREVWAWINAGTIPALVAPWAWIWIKKGKI